MIARSRTEVTLRTIGFVLLILMSFSDVSYITKPVLISMSSNGKGTSLNTGLIRWVTFENILTKGCKLNFPYAPFDADAGEI